MGLGKSFVCVRRKDLEVGLASRKDKGLISIAI